MSRRFSQSICALLALVLASCASDKGKEQADNSKSTGIDRFMNSGFDRKSRKWDDSIRSNFETKSYTADRKVKSGEFKTGDYEGNTQFNQTKAFDAKPAKQAGKTSKDAATAFQQAGKSARDAGKTMKTESSRFDGEEQRDASKEFNQSDDLYKTGLVRDATKSQKKNEGPKMIESLPNQEPRAYSEADVKRMVNRN